MDMKIDVTQIIIAIITVLVIPLVKKYIIPLIIAQIASLKSKMTASQWQMVLKLINDGVKAAETLPEFVNLEKAGTKKFTYVLDSIKTGCEALGLTYDETSVKNAIQSAWDDLYNTTKEDTTVTK
jgi:hypothetical protein